MKLQSTLHPDFRIWTIRFYSTARADIGQTMRPQNWFQWSITDESSVGVIIGWPYGLMAK